MDWGVPPQLGLLVRFERGVIYRAAKTSGRDDYMFGCDFLAGRNHTCARFALVEQGIHRAIRANFRAALICGREYSFYEQAWIYRCFFREPGDCVGVRAKRWLVFASLVC